MSRARGGAEVKTGSPLPRSLAALAALILLTACGTKPVIGVLLPMSGAAQTYGESMKEGIELAVTKARDEGTMPSGTQIVWADSATDPETAVSELRRLSGVGAKLVIVGTTSDEARALLPVLEETGTVALSPSASAPSLTKDSRLFFRVFTSDELEGRRAGRFLFEDQGRRTVLIYAGDSEQARGIEPPFRQVFEQAMGGRVVGKVLLTDPDWQRESADLLAANEPESVYIIGYAEPSIEVLEHLREKSYEGTICLTSAFYSGHLTDQYPELLEGVFFPQPAFDLQDERDLVQNFVASFSKTYGHLPDIYAAHAFDAMRLALFVLRGASSYDVTDIRRGFQISVTEFPGVTGVIQFDDYGDVKHNPIIFTVRDGKVVNYERYVKEQKKLIRDRIRRLLREGN
jgi:branched-chain amino acid transport system substrate-binding protein